MWIHPWSEHLRIEIRAYFARANRTVVRCGRTRLQFGDLVTRISHAALRANWAHAKHSKYRKSESVDPHSDRQRRCRRRRAPRRQILNFGDHANCLPAHVSFDICRHTSLAASKTHACIPHSETSASISSDAVVELLLLWPLLLWLSECARFTFMSLYEYYAVCLRKSPYYRTATPTKNTNKRIQTPKRYVRKRVYAQLYVRTPFERCSMECCRAVQAIPCHWPMTARTHCIYAIRSFFENVWCAFAAVALAHRCFVSAYDNCAHQKPRSVSLWRRWNYTPLGWLFVWMVGECAAQR